MFDFPHSLVVSSLLLQFVPTIALGQRGVDITSHKGIKDPYVEKCALSFTPPKAFCCNIKPSTIFPVSCPMAKVFIDDWLFVANFTQGFSSDVAEFIVADGGKATMGTAKSMFY